MQEIPRNPAQQLADIARDALDKRFPIMMDGIAKVAKNCALNGQYGMTYEFEKEYEELLARVQERLREEGFQVYEVARVTLQEQLGPIRIRISWLGKNP